MFSIVTIRAFKDEEARQRGIQLWLMTMMNLRKGHMALLARCPDFNIQEIIEDLFELLKVSKDETTTEQVLALMKTFVGDDQKFNNLIGLKSAADLPEEPDQENTVPAWLQNSFAYKLSTQLISLQMEAKYEEKPAQEEDKSAFENNNMDGEDGGQKGDTCQPLASFSVTHTLPDGVEEVIPSSVLLSPRVSIAAVRLLHSVFTYEKQLERNRNSAEEKRIAQAIH